MAVDQKKLMGAFGISPVQAPSSTPESESADEEFEDPFLPGMPEEDGGRTPPVLMDTDAKPVSPQDFNADIDYARRSYANIASESQKLVQIAMENAESGSSKDLFAAADTIRAASEATERLVTLYEKLQKLTAVSGSQQPDAGNTYVQNQVVFNGTTEEAMQMVRERMTNGNGNG